MSSKKEKYEFPGAFILPDVIVVDDLSKLTEEQKTKDVLYLERPKKKATLTFAHPAGRTIKEKEGDE